MHRRGCVIGTSASAPTGSCSFCPGASGRRRAHAHHQRGRQRARDVPVTASLPRQGGARSPRRHRGGHASPSRRGGAAVLRAHLGPTGSSPRCAWTWASRAWTVPRCHDWWQRALHRAADRGRRRPAPLHSGEHGQPSSGDLRRRDAGSGELAARLALMLERHPLFLDAPTWSLPGRGEPAWSSRSGSEAADSPSPAAPAPAPPPSPAVATAVIRRAASAVSLPVACCRSRSPRSSKRSG